MQRSGNDARLVGSLREFLGHHFVAEIDHPLGRSGHRVPGTGVGIFPHLPLDCLLEVKALEGS